MLDEKRRSELWQTIGSMDRAERRQLIADLRRTLDDDDADAARWERLIAELRPGMEAGEDEFVGVDIEQVIEEARRGKSGDAT